MWFLKSWIYRYRYGRLPFKMRNFTESLQAECREAIKDKYKQITKDLNEKWTRIKLKDAKDKMHTNWTDLLGRRHKIEQPIFTENEVARNSRHRSIYPVLLIIFIAFETFFYSFFGGLLLPKSIRSPLAVFLVALGLALIFAVALHFAFRWIFEYFEVKHLIEKYGLEKKELKPFWTQFILGIIFCVLFVIINLAVGFLRADLLEPVSNTTAPELAEKIHTSWRMFAILVTFLVAFVMAAIEKEITAKSERWNVYSNWKRQQKERKLYNSTIKNMLKNCSEEKELLIEKYWGVIKDLQRVFRIEVDDDQAELLLELNGELKQSGGFLQNLDDAKYQKYLPVAAARLELFRYGIDNDQEINKQIDNLIEMVREIEAFEESIARVKPEKETEPESNGSRAKTAEIGGSIEEDAELGPVAPTKVNETI